MSFKKAMITAALLVVGVLGFLPAMAQADSPATVAAARQAVAPQFETNTPGFYNQYVPNTSYFACMDADLNTINNNGTKIQTWDCNNTQQQHWIFHAVSGLSDVYTITTGYNGKCLDAATQTIFNNGGKVQLWDCNGQQQQEWIVKPINSGTSILTAINLMGGLCLDANRTQAGHDGQVVQLWACNGWNNQEWIAAAA